MQKIKFITSVEVQNEHRGTMKATCYEEGQEIEVSPASALHWIGRGKAVEVEDVKRKPGRPPKAKTDD